MHGVLLGPQTWARCGREIFTEALLLATDFFVHYLGIFVLKTCLLLETDGERRVLAVETILQVSSYTGY